MSSKPARPAGASSRVRIRLGSTILLGAVAATLFALPASAQASAPKVKVMTRNIYLGADLIPALTAANQTDLFEEAGKIWRAVQETNFPARAKVLADEVAAKKPDLIGIQEAALWRRGPNGVFDGNNGSSTELVYNFLDSLKHQIEKRGLPYRTVSQQQEADFELPLDFNDDDTSAGLAYEGRLTIRDAVLARKGVETTHKRSDNYNVQAPVDLPPTGPGPEDITVPRGWASVDARVGQSRSFRFVDTHLEAFSSFIRNAQAFELAANDGPLDAKKPVILVGDLNSDPDGSSPDAYNAIGAAGFVDRGVTVDTCCHDADLLDAGGQFDERIDHVLTKPGEKLVSSTLLGDDPAGRTPSGLWPSDHGGVVSALRVK